MARIAIHVLWSNFMYEFAGDVYVQTEGGPIGARCTMAASRLVMQEWSEGYLDILTRSGIRVDALQGYVDDGRQWTELIRRGTRFVQRLNRFLWREDWERIDVEENLPEEVRMGKICLEAMNAVNSDLTFTVETVHDFPNKRLATLDLEVEVVDNQIIYSYFQKTMKTPLVIDERSAMSDHQKFSILTNEVIRRMSNISEKISIEEKVQVINSFTQELKNSGYNRKRAREIVVCGLMGLERKRMRRKREGQPFHRPGKMTAGKRNRKKLTGKTDWFKTKSRDIEEEEMKKRELKERIMEPEKKEKAGQSTTKRGKDPQSVMFVPYTPNSELAKELRKVEDMMEALSGMRIKIVEKAGIQMKQILVKSNPWAGSDCGREGCLPCETKLETGQGAGKPCYKRSCIYETWCETCKEGDEEEAREEGRDPGSVALFKYIGETSRSCHVRGRNHLDDARRMSSGSHMLKHCLDKHRDARPEDVIFRMKVLCFKRSAYERQVHESVLIQQNRMHHLLNSKSEFNRCSLPRLTVKLGDREMSELAEKMKIEQRKEDQLEKEIKEMKKQSQKRSPENQADHQPSSKRACTMRSTTDYDDSVDIAIEEAIRLTEDFLANEGYRGDMDEGYRDEKCTGIPPAVQHQPAQTVSSDPVDAVAGSSGMCDGYRGEKCEDYRDEKCTGIPPAAQHQPAQTVISDPVDAVVDSSDMCDGYRGDKCDD